MARAIEHETEPTYIPEGDYACRLDVHNGILLPTRILTKNNQKLLYLVSQLNKMIAICRRENDTDMCPDACAIAQLKSDSEFYIQQNESDLRAVED